MPPVRSTASTDARFVAARMKKIASDTTMIAAEARSVILPIATKFTFGTFLKTLSILKGFMLSGFVVLSNTRRVTTTAVNMEISTPAVSVIAKPRTGPVPTMKRMMPVTIVVRP